MYVIFPAEELILMTYGAAVPRFKPRPTLDNLREPKVPLSYPNQPKSRNQPQIKSYPSSTQSSYASSNAHLPASNRREQYQDTRNVATTSNDTDIFGYSATGADSRDPSIYRDEEYEEDGSGALASGQPESLSSQRTATNSKSQATSSNNDKKGKPPGKSKSRLHLLGFGRSKQQQPAEPARLRDITEIRIQNPTFTRENILARNYDAFFESGEPVYSLEHRTPVTSPAEGETFDGKRPNSFGFFSKMSKSSAKGNARSRSSDPMSMVSEKGDRCHSLQ